MARTGGLSANQGFRIVARMISLGAFLARRQQCLKTRVTTQGLEIGVLRQPSPSVRRRPWHGALKEIDGRFQLSEERIRASHIIENRMIVRPKRECSGRVLHGPIMAAQYS